MERYFFHMVSAKRVIWDDVGRFFESDSAAMQAARTMTSPPSDAAQILEADGEYWRVVLTDHDGFVVSVVLMAHPT